MQLVKRILLPLCVGCCLALAAFPMPSLATTLAERPRSTALDDSDPGTAQTGNGDLRIPATGEPPALPRKSTPDNSPTTNSSTTTEEKEEELLRQNAVLRRAELITGIGSWELYVPDGTFTLSEGAMEVLGWPAHGQTLTDSDTLVVPEDRAHRRQAFNDLIRHGKPYDVEFRIHRLPNGELVTVHSIGEYDPETETVLGTILDVTAWKASEAALKAAQRRGVLLFLGFTFVQLSVMGLLARSTVKLKRNEAQTRQHLERNESLVRILQYEADTVPELVDYALDESIRLTQSTMGYIFFYDEATKLNTLHAWSRDAVRQCDIEDQKTIYHLDTTGIWGEPIRQGRPIIVNHFDRPHPLKKGYPPGHVPLKRYMALPVYDRGKIVATIGLANKATAYDNMDVWQITLLMGHVWTVAERKRSEVALREERGRLRATLLSVGDGVIATDHTGKIELINEIAQQLTGWSEEEAIGRPFEEVYYTVNEETLEKQLDSVRKVLHSGITQSLMNHTVLLTKDGDTVHVADSAAPIKDEHGEINGAVLVFRDIGAEKARAEEIQYLSYYDQLTGLYNRRFLARAIERLDSPENLPLSMVMADINGLKLVNDALGHAVGDQLLQTAARVIQTHCRATDISARWGGDEFIIVLPQTGAAQAEALILQIADTLATEHVESLPASMSFGQATKSSAEEDMSDIFKTAENNMYRAKLLHSPGMQRETIDALMGALFEKNQREEEHSHRVSRYAQSIGRGLGLSETKITELKLIGLFHDIGKIAVDESILNKPEELNASEWGEIRRHPEVGYRLLSAVQGMSDIAQYVLAHHERWDGTGYPRGLKGEEIPLEARITGIADAYDAMISYRPYKQARSKAEAIAELQKNAGIQFDPGIVEVFIDLLQAEERA